MILKKLFDILYGKHPYRTILSWNYLFTRKNLMWVKQYAKELSGKIVVDYGCGKLPYYRYFEPYIDVYYGLDFSFQNDDVKRKVVYVALSKEGEIPDTVPRADLILSFQVLMEVDDIEYYFSQVTKMAKEGTKLLVTTPWAMPALGLNDKNRISPYGIVSLLRKHGFETSVYNVSGYFWGGIGLSLNLLLITKNKYDINTSSIQLSKLKLVFFTPLVCLINIFSLIFDFLFPLKCSPANFMLMAKKGKA
jgi:hypothetical protein